MKYKVRTDSADGFLDSFGIADIANLMLDSGFQVQLLEQAWCRGWFQSKPMHVRTEFKEPRRQPRTLKAGMSGEPYLLFLKQSSKHCAYQTFQGARPSRQRSFRRVNSWNVSMGCQNTLCL